MSELIESLRRLSAIKGRPFTVAERAEAAIAMSEAAAALEAAREDVTAVNRVLAVVEEFEGCTGAGYRYMAANIRSAIDQARGKETTK